MCTYFLTFLPWMKKVTLGILPSGCSVVPLTALGVISECARLSRCSPSAWTNEGPAAQMSAPESCKAVTMAWPYIEAAWMLILGAGLNGMSSTFVMVAWGVSSNGTLRELERGGAVGCALGCWWHTLPK